MKLKGVVRPVEASRGATRTLNAAESGQMFLLDDAAGITYTLPRPRVGLEYTFAVSVTVTSNSHKIITDASTTFMTGSLLEGTANETPGANPGPKFFTADPTASISVTMNGTTTGGVIGTFMTMTCISTTLWYVQGFAKGTNGSTIATAFAAT